MTQPNLSANSSHSSLNSSFAIESGSNDRFVDRRGIGRQPQARPERRQFGSSHAGLTDDGRDLALAIDHYKAQHHRRYLTCDEMLVVIRGLGYSKQVD